MSYQPAATVPANWEDEAHSSLPQVSDQLPELHTEDDISTVGDDGSDTSSILTIPDRNALGWDNLRVGGLNTTEVHEAWEMISVRPTTELRATVKIFGRDVKSSHVVAKDGYTGVRAITSYTQPELTEMVRKAECDYCAPSSSWRSLATRNRPSYAQDLGTRLFQLPGCLPNKLGALLDSRFVATNKNQHSRRDWKVVYMQPVDSVMTDEAPKRSHKRRGLLGRRCTGQQDEPVQKWILILRGRETKTSEDGFEAFDTFANPWLKIDEQARRGGGQMQWKPTQQRGSW